MKNEDESTEISFDHETVKQFDHYKLISKIGKGGMGEVYLAQDIRLDRQVAIKLLSGDFSRDPDKLKRFTQEAKAVSALNHPNILTIYDIGKTGKKNYIATEFIDGKTLRKLLNESTLSISKIVDISIQMAGAISVAHQAGIIHRDIKPDNIMVRQDDIVKVLDFGLAKLTNIETTTFDKVETLQGLIMGTPKYMSPEQARGKNIDHQTDIFSFGIVLYEMLSGHLPFEGETTSDIIVSILTKEPLPLTGVSHIPKELRKICQKTLQKKKENRYKSFENLLKDLEDVRDKIAEKEKVDTAILPQGQLFSEDSEQISEESNKDALLLTEFNNLTGDPVFDETLKLALAVSLEQSPYLDIFPESKIRHTLELMKDSPDEKVTRELGREICLRRGLKAFVNGTISQLGSIYVLTLEAVNAQTEETIGRQLEQAKSKEEVIKAVGRATTGLRKKLGESLSSIKRFDAPLKEATTSSLDALKAYSFGHSLMLKGNPLEAIPYYRQAIEIDPKFASAYGELAVQYINTRQLKKAAEFAIKAFELRKKVSENEKFHITVYYYVMVTGQIEKAIETLRLWKQTYPRHDLYATLAHCYGQIGHYEMATDFSHEAIRMNSKNSIGYGNLAFNLLHLHRFDESKEAIDKAFKLKIDTDYYHVALYWIAFIEENEDEKKNQIAWFNCRASRHIAFDLQAGASGFRGMWRKSKEFSQRAIALAIQSDTTENASDYCVAQALRIAFWRSGIGLPSADDTNLKLALKTLANKALRLERYKVTLIQSALALAFGGLDRKSVV